MKLVPLSLSLLASLLIGLVLGLAGAAPAAAEPAAPAPQGHSPAPGSLYWVPERLTLEDGALVEAHRGLLFVPLDRAQPEGRVIAIEFYRFPRAAGVPAEIPPVFRLNGGPGFPGMAQPLGRPGFYEENIQPLTQLSDIIVVGQRGIGSSTPDTRCAGLPAQPLDREIPEQEQEEALRQASRECRDYWQGHGYDLTGLNVLEAAADVKELATALGYEQITLWGSSFGSHWSMTVLRRYPQLVARAVLGGMEGPDHTYDMPSGVLASLKRAAAEAETSEALSGQIPEGGLLQAFEEVIARVEEEPVVIELTSGEKVRFGAEDVRDMALGYSSRASSRRGYRTWASDILKLYRGDFKAAATARLRNSQRGQRMPTASFFMLDCGSGISAEREAQLNADPARAVVGKLGRFYQVACPEWGSDLGEEFRRGFETEVPTVIVHGTWDTSTPYDNAVELEPAFKNGYFIPVHGGSHGALNEALDHSDSFRDALMAFVRTGDTSALPDEIHLPPLDWEAPPKPASDEAR